MDEKQLFLSVAFPFTIFFFKLNWAWETKRIFFVMLNQQLIGDYETMSSTDVT